MNYTLFTLFMYTWNLLIFYGLGAYNLQKKGMYIYLYIRILIKTTVGFVPRNDALHPGVLSLCTVMGIIFVPPPMPPPESSRP